MSWALENLGETLVTKKGERRTEEVLAGKKALALYFSAHWVSSIAPTLYMVCVMCWDSPYIQWYVVYNFTDYFAQCPPCRGFTPVLAEFYEELQKENTDVEIVFISSDSDLSSFQNYFGSMPWVALPFMNRAKKDALSIHFGIRGIPALIVVNPNTGEKKDPDGRTTVTNARGDTNKVLQKWV
jgi:thiol-disulfide isomerase/thioredoxin